MAINKKMTIGWQYITIKAFYHAANCAKTAKGRCAAFEYGCSFFFFFWSQSLRTFWMGLSFSLYKSSEVIWVVKSMFYRKAAEYKIDGMIK